ncbi:unnamed protein product [Ectocarpus sp. 6 AP-2014]
MASGVIWAALKIQANAGRRGVGHTQHIALYPVCCQGGELRQAGEEENAQGGVQRAGIKGCYMEEASVALSPSKKSNKSTDGRQDNTSDTANGKGHVLGRISGCRGIDRSDISGRSRRGLIISGACLTAGIVLELIATLWAFRQAVEAGGLDGQATCDEDGILFMQQLSVVTQEVCSQRIDSDLFLSETGLGGDYDPCESTNSGDTSSFLEVCRCSTDIVFDAPACSWVALQNSSGVVSNYAGCLARAVEVEFPYSFIPTIGRSECWPANPTGTAELTVTALVVALGSQLIELVVGFRYLKDPSRGTLLLAAASAAAACGVVTVASVLLSLPGFYAYRKGYPTEVATFWLVWAAAGGAAVGALAELLATEYFLTKGRLPYLGAFGNGLVWLGSAAMEVIVASFLVWEGERVTTWELLRDGVIGLVTVEFGGLLAMWAARFLWTRAKLLLAAKGRTGADDIG